MTTVKRGGGGIQIQGRCKRILGNIWGGIFDMQPTNHARSGVNPEFGAES